MVFRREDILAGGIFVLFGAGFAAYALATLKTGTPSQMGSGFFPILLGVILAGLGLIIAVRPIFNADTGTVEEDEVQGLLPWRAIAPLTLAPILFAATVRNFGLVLATATCVAVVCFASSRMTLRMGLGVTLGLTILCIAIFSFGLRLPLPLLPSFISG